MKKILVSTLLMLVIVNNAWAQDNTPDSILDILNKEAISAVDSKKNAPINTAITTNSDVIISATEWKKAGKYASSFFGQWLDSWRSLNVEYFLSHYSTDFNNGWQGFDSFAKRKRYLSKNKTFITVHVSKVSLLKHPQKDIMAVTFYQDYKSNDFSDKLWKRQYWKKDPDERWRIFYEGVVEGSDAPLLDRIPGKFKPE